MLMPLCLGGSPLEWGHEWVTPPSNNYHATIRTQRNSSAAGNEVANMRALTPGIWYAAGCVMGSPSVGLFDGFP